MAKKNKKTLIFLHGWGMNSNIWRYQVEHFSPSYDVIPYNFRGHGTSRKIKGPYCFNNFAIDLKEYISENNIVKPIIVGWSMGSMVGIKFALDYPNHISGLVLIGSTPCFLSNKEFAYGQPPATSKRLYNNLTRNYETCIKDFCMKLFYTDEEILPNKKDEIIDILFGDGFPPLQEAVLQTLNELSSWDIRNHLNKIKITTLIIHGELDKIANVKSANYLKKYIDKSELSIFKNAGHAPFLTASRKFNSVLSEFISRVS